MNNKDPIKVGASRLLQVAKEMLEATPPSNPDPKYPPPLYRNDLAAVEAAYRAIFQAQELLQQAED